MKVEFCRHNLDEKDKQEVRKALDSIFLTTGEWTRLFEEKFAAYLGCNHVVGVSSCTSALELALKYFDIGPGDEVITTPMSFIATANAVEYCRATPVFVDVEADTGNLNADLIEAAITPRTKAILPVHLYGQMCDMRKTADIACRHGLKIIEDCAHCIEGTRDGVRVGELADISCYSFYATKNITCGEGGALACHDSDVHAWLMKARQHGMSASAADRYTHLYRHYDMEFLGHKCNMNNIQGAMLIHQIDRIETLLKERQRIAGLYEEAFADNPAIDFPKVLPSGNHARHLFTLWVASLQRDECMHRLQDAGVGVAVNYRSIHLMSYYREKYGCHPGNFPTCEKIGNATLTIPLYPGMSDKEIQYVADTVNLVTANFPPIR